MRTYFYVTLTAYTLSSVLFVQTLLAQSVTEPLPTQGVQEMPNAMALHTPFIISVTIAFLVWAVSFSIQSMKEKTKQQRHRQALIDRREDILNQITTIEIARESEDLSEYQYKNRLKILRGDLAGALERLQSLTQARKKHV